MILLEWNAYMILTGSEIKNGVRRGAITIDPFNESQLGPNSYDFLLGRRCKIYKSLELDSARINETVEVPVTDQGLLLEPGRLYLFNTEEILGSSHYVPIIRGRSSIGRLGVFIDITADLIDIGSINQLTLQIHCVLPTRLYAGMRIGQITFWAVQGEVALYSGKYANRISPSESLSYLDEVFTNGEFEPQQTRDALQLAHDGRCCPRDDRSPRHTRESGLPGNP
jgi:dCTP deaminase